jgi:hypothetical protein
MQKTIGAALMAAILSVSQIASAQTITTPFTFNWNGIPLGQATLNYEIGGDSYNTSLDGVANGFSKIFVRLTTYTASQGLIRGTTLQPTAYDSDYQLKNKSKSIHLRWDGKGKLTRDDISPITDRQKRPEVSSTQKQGAMDPLSAFWQLHAWLAPGGKLATPGSSADIKIWDGKRLFDLKVSAMRTVVWQEGKKRMNASRLRLRREGLAGFTPDEQASLEATQGKEFYLYFCAEDSQNCTAREPLGMEMPVLLGMLRATKKSAIEAPVSPVESTTLPNL